MFDKLKGQALSIVLAALALSIGYIGYDSHKDVKKELVVAVSQKETAEAELKQLRQDIENNKRFEESKQAEQASLKKDIELTRKEQVQAKKEIQEKIAAIEKRYKDLPKTPANEIAKDMEYSLERVRGAWAVYCIHVPDDVLCK